MLVSRGKLDPNEADEDGDTALMEAAWSGNLETVIALLDLGADLNARTRSGGTPLTAAIREGNERVAGLLRERGARESEV
jgi:ankyrin repeat protein